MSKKVKAVATSRGYYNHVVIERGKTFWMEKKWLKDCRWARPFEDTPAKAEEPPKEEVTETQDDNVENKEGNVL